LNNRLQLVCKVMRWSILVISLVALGYLLWSFFVEGEYNYNSGSVAFQHLWYSSEANKLLLFLITVPGLLLWAVLVFWSFRLFGYFERGEYFSPQSIRCYLWLVWINVAQFVVSLASDVAEGVYYKSLVADSVMRINLDLGEIYSLFFLVVVVHILKAASRMEQENKEFI